MAMSIGVALRLLNRAPVTLRQEYRWRIWRIAITRRSAIVLFVYVVRCAMHLHFYRLSQDMLYGTGLTPNTI
jgi:hypothetical protein